MEIRVRGIVQGVFFRHYTEPQADRLGLAGTVENLPDGSVHVVAQGRQQTICELLAWLSTGPELAVVHEVHAVWSTPREVLTGFRIIR